MCPALPDSADWVSLTGVSPSITVSYNKTHPRQLGDFADFPTGEEDLDKLRTIPDITRPALPPLFATQNEASAASARAVPVR